MNRGESEDLDGAAVLYTRTGREQKEANLEFGTAPPADIYEGSGINGTCLCVPKYRRYCRDRRRSLLVAPRR